MSELAEKFYNTLFKTKDVNADNGIFKLFSRGSVALCLLGSLLCAANQYFGDPILCHFPDTKLSNDFTKLHCWLHGSNLVPKKYREDFDCRVVDDRGIDETEDTDIGDPGMDTSYYQWVIFFLLIQCAIFLIPNRIWKLSERGLIKEFGTVDAKSAVILSDNHRMEETVQRFVKYFTSILGDNNQYFGMFVLCEFLNMLFLVVNFHMTNVFLNNKWGTYGFEVYNYYMEDPRLRLHNPMCNVFPTKVSCTINTVSPGGAIQSVNGLCLLAQNIVNEKVFLILYFWYVFLFIVMGFYAIARIITILVPQVRERMIRMRIRGRVQDARVHDDLVRHALRNCKIGDWFVLHQLARNVNPYFFREFVERLGEHFKNQNMRGSSEGQDKGSNDAEMPLVMDEIKRPLE